MNNNPLFRFRRKVYLDNNATTMTAPDVCKVVEKTLRTCYGNPSSNYRDAHDAAALLDSSRKTVAGSIGALPEEIIFTGGASEANNQLLFSCAENAPSGRKTIVASPIEHPSIIKVLEFLQKQGIVVRYCTLGSHGRIALDTLASLIDNTTLLVCIMYANNETGVLQDIPAIARLAHENGAWMMSDCVQALGKIPLNVKELGVDFASFSAHKIHGPKGTGAAYVRSGLPVSPFIRGGHQEDGLRAGTESTHNIAGFAQACRHIPQSLAAAGRIADLRNKLAEGIKIIMPSAQDNSSQWTLCNTLSVTFPGFDAAEAIGFLDYNGISVSAGSACNTHANEPSHVLKALGLSDEESRQTLRFSLSEKTSAKQITYTLNVLGDYLERRTMPVTGIHPNQAGENLLFSDHVFIVDIRRKFDRKLLKGLPNSHETSFSELRSSLELLPRHKNILVVCQGGTDGPVAAYYLRSKGIKNVSFLMGGIIGWKLFQQALYTAYAGANKQPLIKNKAEKT